MKKNRTNLILQLSTKYSIVTRLTSFVAVEKREKVRSLLLFPWLFPSCRVTSMTGDHRTPSPRPLSVQYFSSLIGTRLCILFSVVLFSFSLVCSGHFPQYVFFISLHHMPVPVQSSFGDLFEACASLVVPRMCSFLILSLHVTPHIHYSILISFTQSIFLVSSFFKYLKRCSQFFVTTLIQYKLNRNNSIYDEQF